MSGKGTVRACLITNPKSGAGGVDLSPALLVLQAQGWDITVRQKAHSGDATTLAHGAVQDGFDVVCACGGDGTVNEIVDALAGTDVALGTLPGGTTNVWAHELGISLDLRIAATQLALSERLQVDVGHLAIDGGHGQHFLLMAGLGMDGAVMARVSRPLKNRLGPLAVGLAALRAAPTFRSVPVRAVLDGVHWQGPVSQVIVGNTRRYGDFTRVTPGAYIDDGLLDICLFAPDGMLGAGKQFASLLVRQHPNETSAETYRAAEFRLSSPTILPLQLDGGAIEQPAREIGPDGVRYTFTVRPKALTVLVPRTYDGELFQSGALHHAAPDVKGKEQKNGKKGKRKRNKD